MSDNSQNNSRKQIVEYAESIRSRRTINLFKQEVIPDQLILESIEVARWAPNHKKTEPWHFYLLGQKHQLQVKSLITELKAEGQDDKARKAIAARLDAIPGWLVLTCNTSMDSVTQMEDYAACACAAQNMMLVLWQAGVGMKWTTGKVIREPRFFDILGIDRHKQTVVGLFWYGYPEHIQEQTRKPVTDIAIKLD